jgi:sugar lactone lactonase YvrE
MTRRSVWLLSAAAVFAISVSALQASTPRFWLTSTQADLLKGQVERLSIDAQGRLVPGPNTTTIFDATGPFLWTMAAAPDGTLLAGGGSEGKVWRVDRQGKSTLFFDAAELEVHALAIAPDGTAYVGTSPDGKVYKVDAQGKSSTFFDPDDKYIWALAFDSTGRLIVATGDKGVVYRVAADGTAQVLCKVPATHATALLADAKGQILIGTETPGRLLRVSTAGKAFVLLDTPYHEIRGMRMDPRGTIYAVAVNGKSATPEQPAAAAAAEPPKISPTPSVSAEITNVTVIDAPTVTGAPAAPARQTVPSTAKGAVYRVDSNGGADVLWELRDDQPFDLDLADDGSSPRRDR